MNKPRGEHPPTSHLSNVHGDATFRYITADNVIINGGGVTSIELGQLTDVDLTSNPPNDGDALVWDTGTSTWIPSGSFLTSLSLDGLSDVAITAPATGSTIIYNGASWVDGLPTMTLDDLSDVAITAPATGSAVIYNGASWVDGTPTLTLDDLSDVAITAPATGSTIIYNGASYVDGLPTMTLDDLSGVVITAPATNEILAYNGTNWVNSAFTSGSFSPTIVDGGSMTLGNSNGNYMQFGTVVFGWLSVSYDYGGVFPNAVPFRRTFTFTLPVAKASVFASETEAQVVVGATGRTFDSADQFRIFTCGGYANIAATTLTVVVEFRADAQPPPVTYGVHFRYDTS